jgi:hypothetical protein
MRKVHVGCGPSPLPGWVNGGIVPRVLEIIEMDATQRSKLSRSRLLTLQHVATVLKSD